MDEKSQREQVAAERRQHTQKLDQLRSEYASGRVLDDEYQDHLRRLNEILGESDSGIVDGRNRLY